MISDTTTAADQAYQSLRDLMLSGELQPGQRVSQLKLARRFGCSTLPVVEAMRRLESEGLLTKQARKMAKVRELSLAELEGLYLVREALESVAARLCAKQITQAGADELWQLNAKVEAAKVSPDSREAGLTDVAFHKWIAQTADCPLVAQELDRLLLIERTAGRFHTSCTSPPNGLPSSRSSHSSHRALVVAIVDHDTDAAEYLMKKHIHAGYLDVVHLSSLSETL